VLVAGDHKAVRDGLRLMLGLLGIKVPGAARQAAAGVPGVVLMEVHLPDCDGAEVTRLTARQPPDVRVVVLTGFSDDDPVVAALRAGARGFLAKEAEGRRACTMSCG